METKMSFKKMALVLNASSSSDIFPWKQCGFVCHLSINIYVRYLSY